MKKVKALPLNSETKERIISSATKLFSKNGFDGTSVRDIAAHAKVNLAAINYHFANKENLYKEVLRFGLIHFSEQIEKLGSEKQRSTVEFSTALFDMLMKNGPTLINNFKVMLDNFDFPEEIVPQTEHAGPPGGKVILDALEKEVKKEIPIEDKMWAVRVIFIHVVHTALIASTSYGKRNIIKKSFERKTVHQSIKRLIEMIVKDLKTSK